MGGIQGCVEGLYIGQTSNPSVAWKKWTVFKINDDDDDDDDDDNRNVELAVELGS